nr:SIS domain-containing protein [uncultured Parolsenella sp.]
MADYKQEVDQFLGIMKEQVEAFVEDIDHDSIVAAKDLIQQAEAAGGRLHVTGIGKPGHVSGYAASLFSSTGTPTYELHGTECVHGSAGQTKPGDVVIAISNSGETGELKATVTCLKGVGVKIIALTGLSRGPFCVPQRHPPTSTQVGPFCPLATPSRQVNLATLKTEWTVGGTAFLAPPTGRSGGRKPPPTRRAATRRP